MEGKSEYHGEPVVMRRFSFLAAALLLAAGCTQTAQTATSPTPDPMTDTAIAKAGARRPQIALVMKSLANEFFKTMEEGAKKHEQVNEDKYKLISNGIKDEQDIAKQQQLIEQMIGQKVAAIVVAI